MILAEFKTENQLLKSVALACPVVLSSILYTPKICSELNAVWVRLQGSLDMEAGIKLLDDGVNVIIIDYNQVKDVTMNSLEEILRGIPPKRLALNFQPDSKQPQKGPNFSALAPLIKYFIIQNPPSIDLLVGLKLNYPSNAFIASITKDCLMVYEKDVDILIDTAQLNLGYFVDLLMSRSNSDREDGLYPTIVVDEQGTALGLCYSNKESITKAFETKTGVYWSRARGLWHKGATSGATQILHSVSLDCDADTLRFEVKQTGSGFCHLNTRTCFGNDSGITGLYNTLCDRKINSGTKSYSKRLFDDENLLNSKLREEADELCDAKTNDDVAWEAADLIYFTLAKCVSKGVSLSNVEAHLDKRSKAITKRPGNAKPQYIKEQKTNINESESKERKEANLFKMPVYENTSSSTEILSKLLLRPILNTVEILDRVKPIVKKVRLEGDSALKEFTKKFDGVDLDSVIMSAPFTPEQMDINPKVKEAIDLAYSNIEKFHQAQMETKPLVVETTVGVTCSRFARPIEKVGLYVPGGTAVLPSSALMLGIPAKVAGCKEIIIATPPQKDGSIVPEVVYVAHKVGASKILKAGGAQAVAAMAYGTETVTKVDKICGPGNQYVTQAKMLAQADSSALIAIDMPAGPSELLVIADKTAEAKYVISDLLSQAEHGVDSQVVLLAVDLSDSQIEHYQQELYRQASVLPRAEIVKESISKSYILRVDSIDDAMEYSNRYAPEHLILNIANADAYVERVDNAGSVFVGPFTPESCGDYASGTNHTLPTYGYARMYSGVNTHTFLKHITAQTITKEGLDKIGDAVTTLAEIEGLEAHRNAVAIRLKDIRK